jgi:hypothetical protein
MSKETVSQTAAPAPEAFTFSPRIKVKAEKCELPSDGKNPAKSWVEIKFYDANGSLISTGSKQEMRPGHLSNIVQYLFANGLEAHPAVQNLRDLALKGMLGKSEYAGKVKRTEL